MAGEKCPTCAGKGYITCVYCKGTGDTVDSKGFLKTCPKCQGPAGSRYGKGKVKCPAYCRDGVTAPHK